MNNQDHVNAEPQTAMALVGVIIRKIPKQLLRTLPLTLLMGILGFLFNFWLMAYVNDGFNPDTWVSKNLIGVTGRMFSATFLWGLVGMIIPMLIAFIKRGGSISDSIGGVFKQPSLIIAAVQKGSSRFNGILCLAVAATLLFEILLSGVAGLLAGSIIMTSVVAFVTGRGSVLIQFIRMAANDVNVYILKKPGLKMTNQEVGTIVGGCGLAMVTMGLLRSILLIGLIQILLNAVWLIFFILGLVLYFSDKPIPKQMIFILLFFGSWLLLNQLGFDSVFADDGGREEIGGTFCDYIQGEGAIQVFIRCIPPAIAIMMGALIGMIASSMPTMTLPDPPVSPVEDGWDSVTEDDDYDTRLRKYINSLDARGAKPMVDPLTGTEYLIKYDPVTDETFDLISKRPFSMDALKDAQRGADGLDDWRQRNAELEREYQENRIKEENERRQLRDQLKKLEYIKERMHKAAERTGDKDEQDAIYERLRSIRKMQDQYNKGEGDLKIGQAEKMFENMITGKTSGKLPEEYTLGENLIDMTSMTTEQINRGDGFLAGAFQAAVIAGAVVIGGPVSVVAIGTEGYFIISKAMYGVKDYVDAGGDSWSGAMVKVTTTAVKDEAWGWGFGAIFKGGKAGGQAASDALNAGKSIKSSAGDALNSFGRAAKDDLLESMGSKQVSKFMGKGSDKIIPPEINKAHSDLQDSVRNQKNKGQALSEHKQNEAILKDKVKKNQALETQSNRKVNELKEARNKVKNEISREEAAIKQAESKADKASDPIAKEKYNKQLQNHKSKKSNLKDQLKENNKLETMNKDKASAAESAQKEAKEQLKDTRKEIRRTESDLEQASNEVKSKKSEFDQIVKKEFGKSVVKEAVKNPVENTKGAKQIDKEFNKAVRNTFK